MIVYGAGVSMLPSEKYKDGCRGVDSQGASNGPLAGGSTKVYGCVTSKNVH